MAPGRADPGGAAGPAARRPRPRLRGIPVAQLPVHAAGGRRRPGRSEVGLQACRIGAAAWAIQFHAEVSARRRRELDRRLPLRPGCGRGSASTRRRCGPRRRRRSARSTGSVAACAGAGSRRSRALEAIRPIRSGPESGMPMRARRRRGTSMAVTKLDSSLARKSAALAISSGLAEAAHRHVDEAFRGAVSGSVGEQLLQQRRVDRARAERVDPHPAAGELDPELARERQHRRPSTPCRRSARRRRPSPRRRRRR